MMRMLVALVGLLWPASVWSQLPRREAASFRIDTVGSIPVTSNLVRAPFKAPDSVRAREVFRVGSVAGDEESEFIGPLMAVSNGPNGQLFVLDKLASLIRVFGSDGAFVREFGRRGQGPGEFFDPSALAWSADGRLWVPEPFGMRYSVFDSLGEFVKTVPRPVFKGVNRRMYPAVFDTSGALLDHASFRKGAGIFRVDTTGSVLDTFPPMAYPQSASRLGAVIGRNQEWLSAVRHLKRSLIWTLAPDGTLWMAMSDSLRLIHRTLAGDTLRIIETRHRPSAFSDSEKVAIKRVSGMYEHVDFSPDVVQGIYASDNGLLFVQIAGDLGRPGKDIDVFGGQGQYLGSFHLEIPVQPLSQAQFVGGHFSYVGVGPFDVPMVVQTRVGG